VARLEEATVAAFSEMVDGIKDVAGVEERLTNLALKAASRTALLSGQFRRMIEVALPGAAVDSASTALRECSRSCGICGSGRFVPGPRGRMVGTLPPQCAECGSLERHRVLYSLLLTMDSDKYSKWSALAVGEALPRRLRLFDQHHYATLDQLATEGRRGLEFDVAIAIFALSLPSNRSIEDVLSLLTRPLRDSGTLMLLDLPSASFRSSDQKQVSATELEHTIAQCIPNASVRSAWAVDRITHTPFVLTIAAQDPQSLSCLVSKFAKAQVANEGKATRSNQFL